MPQHYIHVSADLTNHGSPVKVVGHSNDSLNGYVETRPDIVNHREFIRRNGVPLRDCRIEKHGVIDKYTPIFEKLVGRDVRVQVTVFPANESSVSKVLVQIVDSDYTPTTISNWIKEIFLYKSKTIYSDWQPIEGDSTETKQSFDAPQLL